MRSRPDLHTLDDHPLFAGERHGQRRLYAQYAEQVRLPVGAVLVRQGREPHQVTYIRGGRATISQWGAPIGEVGPGAAVGARELADLEVSDVTITATTPLDAVVLHRRAFRGAWRALPGVRAQVQARGPGRKGAVP
jgi:CRP-like cAMP-binding protein